MTPMKEVDEGTRRARDLNTRPTGHLQNSPFSHLTFAGGSNRNPYYALVLKGLAWLGLVGIIWTVVFNPPNIRDPAPLKLLLGAACLAILGYDSYSNKAIPSAIVLWLLALMMFLGIILR